MTPKLEILSISGTEITPESLEKLKKTFKTVHYYPDCDLPKRYWEETEVWYTRYVGFPGDVRLGDIPNTKVLQLASGMFLPSPLPHLFLLPPLPSLLSIR